MKKSINKFNTSANKLANNIIKNNINITAKEVNEVLTSLGLIINQEDLDKLISMPFLEFKELSENIIKSDKFKLNLGTTKDKIPGIYIWTHKQTGNKYVGSSTQLARRLNGYLKGTHEVVGKFLPLLYKEGLNAFKLDVLILKDEPCLELILEQYYLLHKEYNLNTLRVVNTIVGARSKVLFMYNKDCTELIYSSSTQEEFIFKLNIHHSTLSNCLITREFYLDKYIFTNEPIAKAIDKNLTLLEVKIMLDKDRSELKLNNIKSNKIIIKDSEGNSKIFDSINNCLIYLNTVGSSSRTTLLRKIKNKTLYHGFICEWYGEKVSPLKDKAIKVKIVDITLDEEIILNSLRQAALYLSTTGQTVKLYANKEKIFKDRYLISIEE